MTRQVGGHSPHEQRSLGQHFEFLTARTRLAAQTLDQFPYGLIDEAGALLP